MYRATISVEQTGSGREMRLEFTTAKEKFDVLLDSEQAADLGEAVTDLTDEHNSDAPVRELP
jgi:hypothetical protein